MNFNREIPPLVFFLVIVLCLIIAGGVALYLRHSSSVFSKNYFTCRNLINERKYNEAERYCEVAVKMKPRYASARINLGVVYFYQERLNEAEEQFLKSLEGTSINYIYNKALAYFNLGTIYLKKGDSSFAWEYYNKAYKLMPAVFKRNKADYLLEMIRKKDRDSFNQVAASLKRIALMDFSIREGAVKIKGGSVLEEKNTGFYMEIYPYLRTDYTCRRLQRCISIVWKDKFMTVGVNAENKEKRGALLERFYFYDDEHPRKLGKLIGKEIITHDGFKIYSKITEKNNFRICNNLLFLDDSNLLFIIIFTYGIENAGKTEREIKTMLETVAFRDTVREGK